MGEGGGRRGGFGLVPFLSTSLLFPDNISITQIDPRLKQGCFDPNATNANTGGSIVVPQFWEEKERKGGAGAKEEVKDTMCTLTGHLFPHPTRLPRRKQCLLAPPIAMQILLSSLLVTRLAHPFFCPRSWVNERGGKRGWVVEKARLRTAVGLTVLPTV